MRPIIVSICLLICAATAVVAADSMPSNRTLGAAKPLKPTIRLAQNRNRRPIGPPDRDSVIEGCGVRDALCVANRLMRQMERQVRGQRRRQIDDLGKLMQRACGTTPKDVVCTGEFMSRALRVVTGRNDGPSPIVRERKRNYNSGRSITGIGCVNRGGRFWPTRLRDNRSFGERGWETEAGCYWSVQRMNRRHTIVCTDHTYDNILRFMPQNMLSGSTYGWGMPNLRLCVDAVIGISRGAICTVQRGAGYRIMDIRNRSVHGRAFPSLNRCLAALDNRQG